tara:strand:- start:414 stop:560 length:147 start_codon:yes stop_codon:yes gene_type:complete
MASKNTGSEIISYKCGEQDIVKLNKLRAEGKVLKWWYATNRFYYEIKK